MAESKNSRRRAAPAARGPAAGRRRGACSSARGAGRAGRGGLLQRNARSARCTESPAASSHDGAPRATRRPGGGTSAAASATPTPPHPREPRRRPGADAQSAKATYASCGFPTARPPAGIGRDDEPEERDLARAQRAGQRLLHGDQDQRRGDQRDEHHRRPRRLRQQRHHQELPDHHPELVRHQPAERVPRPEDSPLHDHRRAGQGPRPRRGGLRHLRRRRLHEVAHNNIYGFGEGITSGEGYFHDNYVHSLQSYIPLGSHSYQHTNALIDSGGFGIKCRAQHVPQLDAAPSRGGSSSLMLAYDSAPVTNATVQRQLAGRQARTASTQAGSPARRTSSSRATSSAPSSSPGAGSTGSTPRRTGTTVTGTCGAETSGPTASTPAGR